LAYRGNSGWWRVGSGYRLGVVAGRMVSGDFDGDGDDDVAVFYQYPGGLARIHVWLSTRYSFSYRGNSGWSGLGGYWLSNVGDRMTVGDYNGDGRDDIATFYDYGAGARIHIFLSTGRSFTYVGNRGWWAASRGYALEQVGDRMVSGRFGR